MAKSATILIVEDEQTLNEAYQIILRTAGYNVLSAYNGKEALRITAEHEPTLILLDLRMPHMDGIHFLREFGIKKNHPKVKVIVFTNYDVQKDIDEMYQQGVDRYIIKAWASPKELLRVVKDALASPKTASQ
jgi:response regulator RpfG family c-di-GMP phosphodiesterase